MRDEENDRPAWGKKDPLELEARKGGSYPNAKPFGPDLVVNDRDVVSFDGVDYCVALYPVQAGKMDVRVVSLEDENTAWSETANNNPESINEQVFECIQQCEAMERSHKEYLERQAKKDFWDDFDCRR